MRKNFSKTEHKVIYVECACGYSEHILRFELFDWGFEQDQHEEDSVDLNIEFLMPRYRFLRRIWQSLKYVFRFRKNYEGFYITAINVHDVDQVIDIFQKFKEKTEYYKSLHEARSLETSK